MKKLRSVFYKVYFKSMYGTKIYFDKDIYFGNHIKIYDYSNFNCSVGKKTYFRGYLNLIFFSSKNEKLTELYIGENCFFNLNNSFSVGDGLIKIGKNCLFGENVKLYNHNHLFNNRDMLISDQGFSFSDITIGDNVWIGSNVLILKGTKIEDNCVISAGSIVKQHIPKNSLFINGQIEEIKYK